MFGFVTWPKICSVVVVCSIAGLLGACSSAKSQVSCGNGSSISSFVASFSQGLDNFSEDQYAQLRTDSLNVYEVAVNAVTDKAVSSDATKIARKISTFVNVMETVDWDVNRALNISSALSAASVLGAQESLRQANSIEAAVIARCGMPSTVVPSGGGEVTLPMNPIPSATATDPITNVINDSSELTVVGTSIAIQFGLTVSDSEALCLGTALSNVYDVSGATSNNAQYQKQFQRAFDNCGIKFSVPG